MLNIQKQTNQEIESKNIFHRKQETPAFIGNSNWDIDASKLNRNNYLARPEPKKSDLKETVNSIISYQVSEEEMSQNIKEQIKELENLIPEAYINFRAEQKVN